MQSRATPVNHKLQATRREERLNVILKVYLYSATLTKEEKKGLPTPESLAEGHISIGDTRGEYISPKLKTLLAKAAECTLGCTFTIRADGTKPETINVPSVTIQQMLDALIQTYESCIGPTSTITNRMDNTWTYRRNPFAKHHHQKLFEDLGITVTPRAGGIHFKAGGLGAEKQEQAGNLEQFMKNLQEIATKAKTNTLEAEKQINEKQINQVTAK